MRELLLQPAGVGRCTWQRLGQGRSTAQELLGFKREEGGGSFGLDVVGGWIGQIPMEKVGRWRRARDVWDKLPRS